MSFADFERAAEQSQAAGRVPGPHRRPHRVRLRADRRLLPRARDLPDRGLRPRRTAPAGTAASPVPTATPASTRCTRPRRSRPARAACWSRSRPEVIEHARDFRNYGKPELRRRRPQLPDERVHRRARAGAESSACPRSSSWKNDVARDELDARYPSRLELPDGMVSGLYKYIVFDWLERSTGPRLRRAVPPDHGARRSTCRTATGSRATTPACRCTTGRVHRRDEGTGHRRFRLHRLARGRQAARARARAGDLRPAAVAVARAGLRSTRCSARSPTARRSSARCTAATRSRTWRPSPTSTTSTPSPRTPSASTRAARSRCSRRPGAPGSSGSSTRRRSGSTPTASPRRSTRTRCCRRRATCTRAPSSPGELYCKAYQELYGIDYTILRFGIPYGPRAREAAVIPAFVNKALRGRAADARRRRQPVAQVRLRRGPRRRGRARARGRRGQPRLQPRQRRDRHDQADRRDDQGADGRRRDRPHAGPPGRLRRQGRVV